MKIMISGCIFDVFSFRTFSFSSPFFFLLYVRGGLDYMRVNYTAWDPNFSEFLYYPTFGLQSKRSRECRWLACVAELSAKMEFVLIDEDANHQKCLSIHIWDKLFSRADRVP
jgi:hypothetical protein